jgi:hypothetical protein
MGLDIRLPIGLMFAIIGLLLLGFGVVGNKEIYQRSLGINVNLLWGALMVVVGVIMLALGWRGTAAMRPAEKSREGRKIEEIEHRTGKEK